MAQHHSLSGTVPKSLFLFVNRSQVSGEQSLSFMSDHNNNTLPRTAPVLFINMFCLSDITVFPDELD